MSTVTDFCHCLMGLRKGKTRFAFLGPVLRTPKKSGFFEDHFMETAPQGLGGALPLGQLDGAGVL